MRNNPLSCGCANLRLYIHLVDDKKVGILQYFLILGTFLPNSFAVLWSYTCLHIPVHVKSSYPYGIAPQLLPGLRFPWIQSLQGRGQWDEHIYDQNNSGKKNLYQQKSSLKDLTQLILLFKALEQWRYKIPQGETGKWKMTKPEKTNPNVFVKLPSPSGMMRTEKKEERESAKEKDWVKKAKWDRTDIKNSIKKRKTK